MTFLVVGSVVLGITLVVCIVALFQAHIYKVATKRSMRPLVTMDNEINNVCASISSFTVFVVMHGHIAQLLPAFPVLILGAYAAVALVLFVCFGLAYRYIARACMRWWVPNIEIWFVN